MAAPALLVIDVQCAIDHPRWGRRNNPQAEANIARLLAAWRARAWPIIHVRHAGQAPHSTYHADGPGYPFKPQAQPLPGECVLTKRVHSAFIGTDLQALLQQQGIAALVICGVITNNSVEATARMAGNLGFNTTVVSDASATFDKLDFDGRLHRAEQVHAMALANLQGEYAAVLATQQVLGCEGWAG